MPTNRCENVGRGYFEFPMYKNNTYKNIVLKLERLVRLRVRNSVQVFYHDPEIERFSIIVTNASVDLKQAEAQ